MLDRPLGEVAATAAALGLDGVEVTARPPHLDMTKEHSSAMADVRSIVEDAGSRVIALGSYLGTRERTAFGYATVDAVSAGEMGASFLRVWAHGGEGLIRYACSRVEVPGLRIVVERHINTLADTPQRCREFIAAVDHPLCSLNYQVLDNLPLGAADVQADEARELAPITGYVHLKNYLPPKEPGGPMRPWAPLASGVLDYRAILGALLDAGYTGPLAFEFLSSDPRPAEERLAEDVAFVRSVLDERSAP